MLIMSSRRMTTYYQQVRIFNLKNILLLTNWVLGDFQHVDCCIDLRVPKILGEVMETMPIQKDVSYNYCLIKSKDQDLAFVARVSHSITRRAIEIYSNQPGVQFTTFKNVFSIETQNYPDAINHVGTCIIFRCNLFLDRIIYCKDNITCV